MCLAVMYKVGLPWIPKTGTVPVNGVSPSQPTYMFPILWLPGHMMGDTKIEGGHADAPSSLYPGAIALFAN